MSMSGTSSATSVTAWRRHSDRRRRHAGTRSHRTRSARRRDRGGATTRPSRRSCHRPDRSPRGERAAGSPTDVSPTESSPAPNDRPLGRGRVATISARIDSAISCGVRAPRSRPAGVWTAPFIDGHRSSEATTASPRFLLATSPTYGTLARNAAASTSSSPRPCDATTTADVSRGISPSKARTS